MSIAIFVGIPAAFAWGDNVGGLRFTMTLCTVKLILLWAMKLLPPEHSSKVEVVQVPVFGVVLYLSSHIPAHALSILNMALTLVFPIEAFLFVFAVHLLSLHLHEMMDDDESLAKSAILGGAIISVSASVMILVYLYVYYDVPTSATVFIVASVCASLVLFAASVYVEEGIILDPSLVLLYLCLVAWCLVDDIPRVKYAEEGFSTMLFNSLKFATGGFNMDRSIVSISIFLIRLLCLYMFGSSVLKNKGEEVNVESPRGRVIGDLCVILLYANLIRGLWNPTLVGNWAVRFLQAAVALCSYTLILFMPEGDIPANYSID
eukprot:CFRG4303T1